MRPLQTIYTVGPASYAPHILKYLIQNGDQLRINSSHLTPQALEQWLSHLSYLFQTLNRTLPVIIDLQGAKMRIGTILSTQLLPDRVTLFYGEQSEQHNQIPVPHLHLFQLIQSGDHLSLNDGTIELMVEKIDHNTALCQVIQNGSLSSYKGINRKGHPLPYQSPQKRDLNMIDIALKYPFTSFALSFTHTGKERTLFPQVDRHFIAKIERPEALKYLQMIDQQFDALWLCRGDLGAEGGLTHLYRNCQQFEKMIPKLNKPTALAGEVLEHLTDAAIPTRSEMIHFYEIAQKGYQSVVFSNETAVGCDPINVINWVNQLNQ